MPMGDGISHTENRIIEIPYLSPLALRSKLNEIILNERDCFEVPGVIFLVFSSRFSSYSFIKKKIKKI